MPASQKDEARRAALDAIAQDGRLALRINSLRTRHGLADIVALGESGVTPFALFVPMVEDATEMEIVRAALGPDLSIIPLIETVRGIGNAGAIAADPSVAMLMLGGADLAAQLGVAVSWEGLRHARGALIMACAAAGKKALDVPFIALDDTEGLAVEAGRARDIGFAGKAAIHPAQIPTITAAFAPSEADLAEAREAATVYAAAEGAAVRFKGRMLEAPIMNRYRQILAIAGEPLEA